MANEIKCPKCGNPIDVENVISAELEHKFQERFQQKLQESLADVEQEKLRMQEEQKLFEEKKKKENEMFQQRLLQEKQRMESEIQSSLRKSISADYDNQLRILDQQNRDNEEKLKQAREKEFIFLQKEQELKNREEELGISVQKMLQDERPKLTEKLRQLEEEKFQTRESELQLKLREMEMQLENQRKLAEEMKRKAEQSSSQMQGEVQELAVEELLRTSFPFDSIDEIRKGARGADCVQTVRNSFGQECGKILFESKRTKEFQPGWIEKVKADMRSLNAEVSVIVTQVRPRELEGMGEKEGVWICSFNEVKGLVYVLRDSIIKIHNAINAQQNKGDKVHLLYNYLTSHEFSSQWKAVREGFLSMKMSIQRERDSMEKLWKSREKQLEKVLINAAHIHGSIEGIAGQHAIDFNIEEDNHTDNLLES